MKHFKPYVNLIHYKKTGQYVLNAVVNLPSEYSVIDQKQQKVEDDWIVTLFVQKLDYMKSPEKNDKLEEFSFKLESHDIKNMNKIKLEVKPHDSSSFTDGDKDKIGTNLDPEDAEDDEMPEK